MYVYVDSKDTSLKKKLNYLFSLSRPSSSAISPTKCHLISPRTWAAFQATLATPASTQELARGVFTVRL